MLMDILKEYGKMTKYLLDNTKIRPIEITDYCLGGKQVVFHKNCIKDNKKTRLDYSFHIEHFNNPEENYANAEYFMYVSADYKDGSCGYGSAYNSIEDFINDNTIKKLIEEENEPEEEPIEALEGQMSLFDEVEEEKTENFEEIQFDFGDLTENDPIEELLSYGIDEYYSKMLYYRGTMTIREIEEELSKLPKYKEYMKKFGEYLKSILPITTYEELGSNFDKKCLIKTDTLGYRINGNRQQSTAYCLEQYMKNMENKSLFD